MKTIKNVSTGEIRRVREFEASERVKRGWTYIPKSLWKAIRAGGNKDEK
jgi:hypothetical protein